MQGRRILQWQASVVASRVHLYANTPQLWIQATLHYSKKVLLLGSCVCCNTTVYPPRCPVRGLLKPEMQAILEISECLHLTF